MNSVNKLIIHKRNAYSYIEIQGIKRSCENTVNDMAFLIHAIIDYARDKNIFVFHDSESDYQKKEDYNGPRKIDH